MFAAAIIPLAVYESGGSDCEVLLLLLLLLLGSAQLLACARACACVCVQAPTRILDLAIALSSSLRTLTLLLGSRIFSFRFPYLVPCEHAVRLAQSRAEPPCSARTQDHREGGDWESAEGRLCLTQVQGGHTEASSWCQVCDSSSAVLENRTLHQIKLQHCAVGAAARMPVRI